MNKEEMQQVESSQRQHHEVLLQQERMAVAIETAEFNLFKMIKPALSLDGSIWCILYGENIQDGIAGFGKSPYLAVLDWNKAMYDDAKIPAGVTASLDEMKEINHKA